MAAALQCLTYETATRSDFPSCLFRTKNEVVGQSQSVTKDHAEQRLSLRDRIRRYYYYLDLELVRNKQLLRSSGRLQVYIKDTAYGQVAKNGGRRAVTAMKPSRRSSRDFRVEISALVNSRCSEICWSNFAMFGNDLVKSAEVGKDQKQGTRQS